MSDTTEKMVCSCGQVMVKRSLGWDAPYWACSHCDANGRCRRCRQRFVDGNLIVRTPDRIGLVHSLCPSEALRGRVEVLELDHAAAAGRVRDLEILVRKLSAIGDEYQHALEHIQICAGGCEDCRTLARTALEHVNFNSFLANSYLAELEAKAAALRAVVLLAQADVNRQMAEVGRGPAPATLRHLVGALAELEDAEQAPSEWTLEDL